MPPRAHPARLPPFTRFCTGLSIGVFATACGSLVAILALFSGMSLRAQTPGASPARRDVIIDTDAGPDDLMAIAFLLSRPDIRVEAITVVNGTAHVLQGGKNILRLLALAGRDDIPVFLGKQTPLSGNQEFPEPWRKNADELPGIKLPEPKHPVDPRSAEDFLTKRLLDPAHPVQILAIGPLTNIANVFLR